MRQRKEAKAPITITASGLRGLVEQFLEWMGTINYSGQTVATRRKDLGYFINWCEERAITRATEITKTMLEQYQKKLYHYRKENGRALNFRTQYSRLTSVRQFFRWLAKQKEILYNPAAEMEMPKLPRRLPQHILSVSEMEKVLRQIDINTMMGLRDRAIMETFYATGIRRTELFNLKVHDLDIERGILMVRQGKGNKDRMIPIGARAVAWVEKYLNEVRPAFARERDDGTLFLSSVGTSCQPQKLTDLTHKYISQAELGKQGSCHLLRHTMATLMLEGGADIRFIQQMLGHDQLSSTQIYTHVSIRKLQEVYKATHPGANLEGGPKSKAEKESTEEAEQE